MNGLIFDIPLYPRPNPVELGPTRHTILAYQHLALLLLSSRTLLAAFFDLRVDGMTDVHVLLFAKLNSQSLLPLIAK